MQRRYQSAGGRFRWRVTRFAPWAMSLLIVLAAGCGGGGDPGAAETDSSGGGSTTPPPSSPSPPSNPTPPPAPTVSTDVVTYKNDLSRTGQNLTESVLTLANVKSANFGLHRVLAVDGKVDAQPLYLSQVTIGSVKRNLVYVATEHGSVWAFDADTGDKMWQVSLVPSGESTSDDHTCGQITPEIGITSTPVIDRTAGANGTLYVVVMSKAASSTYHQRIHALDVTTGAELLGGPTEIAATYPTAAGGTATFDPSQYAERAALLLLNGTVYTTWTSHCDFAPYSGWVIAFDAKTLARGAVLNIAPNSGAGPSIWMSGGGPAADSAGNIYLLTANGLFDTTLDANGFPNHGDYGNSFLKITPGTGSLAVNDYFTMMNEVDESAADIDLGSGGGMLLPDAIDGGGVTRHLMLGAGKDGNIYVVNRDSMGKFSSTANNNWQTLPSAVSAIFSTPAYFNGTVYYGGNNSGLKAFPIANAKLAAQPSSQSATQFPRPGSAIAISANGTGNGIVWAHENANPAVLHAYDATNLANELYNSNQAANGRDHFGAGNKFITPTIADGKVFVGTTSGVAVFGLL